MPVVLEKAGATKPVVGCYCEAPINEFVVNCPKPLPNP
jgi:hypothetical protein